MMLPNRSSAVVIDWGKLEGRASGKTAANSAGEPPANALLGRDVVSVFTSSATATRYDSRLSGRLLKKSASIMGVLLNSDSGAGVRENVADLIHLLGCDNQRRQQAQYSS